MDEIEHNDKDAQISAQQARITELEAALEAAHVDSSYSILTRPGIEHRWHQRPLSADPVIFFDTDGIPPTTSNGVMRVLTTASVQS